MTINAAISLFKGRLQGGYSLTAERVRRPRAERYTPHPGGSGIMPAGTTTGARGASRPPRRRVRHAAPWSAVFGKPGPTLSLRDESPVGENRSGTPAGERARKRRAAQAAFLRGASYTPLACGHETPAFAGVPLPFIFSWSSSLRASLSSLRAIAKQSTCSVRNLDCLVASAPRNDVIGKTRTRKNRAARTIFLSSPAMRGGMRWRVVKPRVLFAGHEFGI